MGAAANLDTAELAKFESLAHQYWDPAGPLHTLHSLNPVRSEFIAARARLAGARVADVGCGGGLLSESLAALGARVTGIDLSPAMISVAQLHAAEMKLSIDYRGQSAAALAAASPAAFDVVCCMELAEHVPDPAALVAELARLLRPGGSLFISTINRTPQAFLGAIVAAEYLLGLVPRGTHEYARLVRPAELARAARAAGLELRELAGLDYNPFTRRARLGARVHINYLAQFALGAVGA
ncbi:MAG TPA: bifunctional 2-polyprenyl-6-hydroxyphenol methylase/3-demethylubiquinol 3-O-methyltransferase UbiG [Steroidobacteraceae bacterium]|nr:bifunctional 2-polyprenyl-6-hydroxyphenol methylase/3-demethylubiquinol 3-O-methyltransferase UbiG [Steroidobacteraceae bacterium]